MPLEILHRAAPCRNVPVTFTLELTEAMDYCYVEFEPRDASSLERLKGFFALIKAAKDEDRAVDDPDLAAYLTYQERAFFWNPSPEEQAEWNSEWFATPLPKRHSTEMLLPQWHLESMLEALSDGEYDLVGVLEANERYVLAFNPHAYPYGGTGSLVALVECFGNRVVGVEDGTGYVKYVPRKVWRPKREL